MALATRCPACTTVFRISTAQAAAKAGKVRCGICRHVFNSLDALVRVEDLDVVEEVIVDPADGTIAKAEAPSTVASAEERVPAEQADALLAPTVRDERPTISEWWLPEVPPTGPPHPVRAPGATAAPLTGPHVDSLPPAGRHEDPSSELSPIDGTNPVFMHPAAGTASTSRPFRWALATLSLVAALVLVGQLAYLFRDELAVRWSPARPWLSSACALVGCRVGYPVHAAAITIESASVQTSAPVSNVYVLTALLRNRDGFDLRYPNLQLVLTDLRDQPILRRDLRPEDYLPPGRTPESGFPAQSELPVRVVFELSELRFVGFRLNQSYP